jgi:ASC-1-like (ASCH) protein
MKFLVLLALVGCSTNRARMTGTVMDDQMYFDRMVPVEIANAPDSRVWVKLNKKQLRHVKPGDKVVFYVTTAKVEYDSNYNIFLRKIYDENR